MKYFLPYLITGNDSIDQAFRIAIGDLLGNVVPFKNGLLDTYKPVIMAGLDYNRPWTRDAAINAWNGASLLMPEVSRNTLFSVLESIDNKVRIGGQYWDAIIWTTGAWWHYLYTGDREFLSLALEVTQNSLKYFEETEFDAELNLFRGPACYQDGISAYPDPYAITDGSGFILDWPRANPDQVSKPGFGIPMQALSTNCLYYNAYISAQKMAGALGITAIPDWGLKAENIKKAINQRFKIKGKGHYRYLADLPGRCDHQEGLGHSFVLLFGLADDEWKEAVFSNVYVTPAGIPCVWPTFSRYEGKGEQSYGRHSGTVWPHIQGFWAHAAARFGKVDIFAHEMFKLAEHACRDSQFTEIYHPLKGTIYGGLQESKSKGIISWQSRRRQTWSSTAYLRMVLLGLIGIQFEPDGIRFSPCIPKAISNIKLQNLNYRETNIEVQIEGSGTKIRSFRLNGKLSENAFISADEEGQMKITIMMS